MTTPHSMTSPVELGVVILRELTPVVERAVLTPGARVAESDLAAYAKTLAAAEALVSARAGSVSVDYAFSRLADGDTKDQHARCKHALNVLQRLYGPQAQEASS